MLLQSDAQLLARLVLDHPHRCGTVGLLGQPARRAHPVQRLVRAIVGVDTHRPVGLDEQQAAGRWQMSGQAPDVVDGALGDHETHPNHLRGRFGKLV